MSATHGDINSYTLTRIAVVSICDIIVVLTGHQRDATAVLWLCLFGFNRTGMITQAELKELFDYNPETGVFTRLKTTHNLAKKGSIANSKNTRGYLVLGIKQKNYYQHRLAWVYQYGSIKDNDIIDHINRVHSDNRIANLRLTTQSVNLRNRRLSSNNKVGVHGIIYHKKNRTWVALINTAVNNRVNLGSFKKLEDAIKARKDAELKYGYL